MSRIIEIPGGAATIRSPEDVKQRARHALEVAAIMAQPAYEKINGQRAAIARERGVEPADVNPEDVRLIDARLDRADYDAMYEVQTATIMAYLASWTLDRPLPKRAEDLDELPAGLFDALREGTAEAGADAVAPVDFSPNPDPESPTVGDSASSRSLSGELEQGSPLTPRSESSGEKPHIAASTVAATATT